MSVKMRQEIERKIAAAAIDGLLAAGFILALDNGGETDDEYRGTDKAKCLEAMFATDDERLYVYTPAQAAEGFKRASGWVYFVYGNDGWDVINDYITSLEPHLKAAQAIADHYAD